MMHLKKDNDLFCKHVKIVRNIKTAAFCRSFSFAMLNPLSLYG